MTTTNSGTTSLPPLGDAPFVSLTTFRRSGEPVSTPVWVVRQGDELLVMTPEATGKLKRLRHDPRVEVVECSRRGSVAGGADRVTAVGTIDDSPEALARVRSLLRDKYGLEYRVVMGIEKLVTRGDRRRVVIRVTEPPAA